MQTVAVWLSVGAITALFTGYMWLDGRMKTKTALVLPLLVCYLAFMFSITVMYRTRGSNPQFQPELFWSYRKIFSGTRELAAENYWNVVLFIPLGFLTALLLPGKRLWVYASIGLILSLGIEIIQLISCRGLFEFDDMVHNTLGMVFGCGVLSFLTALAEKGFLPAAVFCGCMAALAACIPSFFEENSVQAENISGKLCFQLECAELKNGRLELSGFAFRYDHAVPEEGFRLILKEELSGRRMELMPEYGLPREDVNGYFLCEYDYTLCGFHAADEKGLINPNLEYRLYAAWDSEPVLDTEVYLTGTDIHYAPERLFKAPQAGGTDLEEIVRDGVLRVYRPDESCFVYQYGGCLYWIVDEEFAFEADASTYIQYQLYTTQTENLPQERLEHEWYWDNIGGYFESHEITEEMDCGPYRVCRRKLPEEYSIKSIVTGYYVKDWVWKTYFRPYYVFD